LCYCCALVVNGPLTSRPLFENLLLPKDVTVTPAPALEPVEQLKKLEFERKAATAAAPVVTRIPWPTCETVTPSRLATVAPPDAVVATLMPMPPPLPWITVS